MKILATLVLLASLDGGSVVRQCEQKCGLGIEGCATIYHAPAPIPAPWIEIATRVSNRKRLSAADRDAMKFLVEALTAYNARYVPVDNRSTGQLQQVVTP